MKFCQTTNLKPFMINLEMMDLETMSNPAAKKLQVVDIHTAENATKFLKLSLAQKVRLLIDLICNMFQAQSMILMTQMLHRI